MSPPTSRTPDDLAPSRVQVDLGALGANVAAWRAWLRQNAGPQGPARLCAVVKADAYGLGAVPIARGLADRGVDMLAVFSLDQALRLLEAGIGKPILVFMPVRTLGDHALLWASAARGQLQLTVHDPGQLSALDRAAAGHRVVVPIHLQLDTGMTRAGLDEREFVQCLNTLGGLGHTALAGISTHLATADSDLGFLDEQVRRFDLALAESRAPTTPGGLIHVANTAAALRGGRYHYGMVRIGLGLFGYGPDMLAQGPKADSLPALRPIVRWTSRLVHVERRSAGCAIGYGCTFRLERQSVLGLVPVGYGDGYPLLLSNCGEVRVLGASGTDAAAPVLGNVNMDQIVVDLTDAIEAWGLGDPRALLDREVELISSDPESRCALPRLAKLAQSSCYELLCRLGPRVPRRYVDG